MKLERWEKAMFIGMAVVVYTGIVFLIGVIFGVASQYKEELNMARKYNEDILVEITCNKCGKVEDVSDDEHGWKAEAFREFDLVYGYGSTLYDMSGVRFDLCEHCVKDLVTDFKIAAESRDYEMLQGFNSEGMPFVYLGFEDDEKPTQERLDEMCEMFVDRNKEGE